jgi:hypothetical protein
MDAWIDHEINGCAFAGSRLRKRFNKVLQRLCERCVAMAYTSDDCRRWPGWRQVKSYGCVDGACVAVACVDAVCANHWATSASSFTASSFNPGK